MPGVCKHTIIVRQFICKIQIWHDTVCKLADKGDCGFQTLVHKFK